MENQTAPTDGLQDIEQQILARFNEVKALIPSTIEERRLYLTGQLDSDLNRDGEIQYLIDVPPNTVEKMACKYLNAVLENIHITDQERLSFLMNDTPELYVMTAHRQMEIEHEHSKRKIGNSVKRKEKTARASGIPTDEEVVLMSSLAEERIRIKAVMAELLPAQVNVPSQVPRKQNLSIDYLKKWTDLDEKRTALAETRAARAEEVKAAAALAKIKKQEEKKAYQASVAILKERLLGFLTEETVSEANEVFLAENDLVEAERVYVQKLLLPNIRKNIDICFKQWKNAVFPADLDVLAQNIIGLVLERHREELKSEELRKNQKYLLEEYRKNQESLMERHRRDQESLMERYWPQSGINTGTLPSGLDFGASAPQSNIDSQSTAKPVRMGASTNAPIIAQTLPSREGEQDTADTSIKPVLENNTLTVKRVKMGGMSIQQIVTQFTAS